jgi:hypothetical protein
MKWINHRLCDVSTSWPWQAVWPRPLPSCASCLRPSSSRYGSIRPRRGGGCSVVQGHTNKLTDAGQVVRRNCWLGTRIGGAFKQCHGLQTLRVQVRIVDCFSKCSPKKSSGTVPAMTGVVADLLRGQAGGSAPAACLPSLDILLASEPASSSVNFKCSNHLLGGADTTLCAGRLFAAQLKGTFPHVLQDAPAFLPVATRFPPLTGGVVSREPYSVRGR